MKIGVPNEMAYAEAVLRARAETEHLGSLHAWNHPDGGEGRPGRAREIMDEARQAADRAARVAADRERRAYSDSHSQEWHDHQHALSAMGPKARCEDGCMCQEEPW